MERYSEEKLYWVSYTYDVIDEVKNLLGYLKDAETGQRGYLLTSDVSYLEPYYLGIGMVEKTLINLETLASDNTEQLDVLSQLETSIGLKLEELKETIDLHEAGRIDDALEIVKDNSGKFFMDRIRESISRFIGGEQLQLSLRVADYRAHKAQISTLIIIELILFIALALFSLAFLNKNLFYPLNLLLTSTHKMERGEVVDINDITNRDEMGYLLASFYKMHLKIHKKVSRLDHKAHHDELTGVRNRMNLYAEIDQILEQASFNTAIIFIDLNKFKMLNDTMGHEAGDEVLIETAKRLKAVTRTGDLIYRYGGDEFVVVIDDIGNHSSLNLILEKIETNFQKPMDVQDNNVVQKLSIGVALSPEHGNTALELIRKADEAMYISKSSSNNSYVIYKRED